MMWYECKKERHCFMLADIRDMVKMDIRSQATCDSFLRKTKQVVIWIFSIFMTTPAPP